MSERLKALVGNLESALERLEEALRQPKDEFIRDSAIQRFESTFELLWKCFQAACRDAGLTAYSPRDSMRGAFQLGLIEDDPVWLAMLEDRNLTSHTYHGDTAEAIFLRLPQYTPKIRTAVATLKAGAQGL